MRDWLEKLAGPEYATAVLWTLLALVALVVVLVAVRVIRGLTSGTFVAGGRNRKTRLAVMDAAAVDSHRRLVLVRRDDVEHLILIGGPTDVVVERDIRVGVGAPRRPAPGAPGPQQPRPRPPELQPAPPAPAQPVPVTHAPAPIPQPPAPQVTHEAPRPTPPSLPPLREPVRPTIPEPSRLPADPVIKPQPARVQPSPAQVFPPQPAAPVPAASRPAPVPAPVPHLRDDIDSALMRELEVSLDEAAPKVAAPASLDDEMTKLLGELSTKKR